MVKQRYANLKRSWQLQASTEAPGDVRLQPRRPALPSIAAAQGKHRRGAGPLLDAFPPHPTLTRPGLLLPAPPPLTRLTPRQ
jgi:hypothetical protein